MAALGDEYNIFKNFFIYSWLHWAFPAAHGLPLVMVSRTILAAVLVEVALLIVEHRL